MSKRGEKGTWERDRYDEINRTHDKDCKALSFEYSDEYLKRVKVNKIKSEPVEQDKINIDRYRKERKLDIEKLAWEYNRIIDVDTGYLKDLDSSEWFIEYLEEEIKKYKGE